MYLRLLAVASILSLAFLYKFQIHPIIVRPITSHQSQYSTVKGSWIPTNPTHYSSLDYPTSWQPFDASSKCASGYWEGSPTSTAKKRVAIMYSGGSRTFYEVWPSQLRYLFENNPEVEVDIFMATNLGNDSGTIPLFECQQFDQKQFTNRVKTLRFLTLDMEPLVQELHKGVADQLPIVPNFHYHNLPQPQNSKHSLILSFWLMHVVWMDFQRWIEQHNIQYDLVIRMRPDIMFYSPDNSGFVPGLHFNSIIAALEAKAGRSLTQPLRPVKYLEKLEHSSFLSPEPEPRIHLASAAGGWGAYPDQFAIMTTSTAKTFHNTLLYMDGLLCPTLSNGNCIAVDPSYKFHPETLVNMTVALSQPLEGGYMKLEELWDKQVVQKTQLPAFGSTLLPFCLFRLAPTPNCRDIGNNRAFATDFPSNHAPPFYSIF